MTFSFKDLCKGGAFDAYGNSVAPQVVTSFWDRLMGAWAIIVGDAWAVTFDKRRA